MDGKVGVVKGEVGLCACGGHGEHGCRMSYLPEGHPEVSFSAKERLGLEALFRELDLAQVDAWREARNYVVYGSPHGV